MTTKLREDYECLRKALAEIRNALLINIIVNSDPREIIGELEEIYQIADDALSNTKSASQDSLAPSVRWAVIERCRQFKEKEV
ncbi:hypothetical protein ZC03_083 [Pseudomonas phage ZC03]|uniref:Uncharacterized protein n=2 Tax=Zicotriavirus TaxID=2843161 RepID=A0A1L2C984_9CAUD|nr:hypothetical protein HWA93_gp46 [Pseudomonas phage ZC03]YP_009830642.1 hypothetical protein HWA94_gp46 [Pseudomonas phage ZC08]AMD43460.1 hypothetical protein ZC03_083 [Pseudomonas phage ZC03]AMD43485.1 hypothetical protein ZC08_080 [Pseudomonas phage ZC08]